MAVGVGFGVADRVAVAVPSRVKVGANAAVGVRRRVPEIVPVKNFVGDLVCVRESGVAVVLFPRSVSVCSPVGVSVRVSRGGFVIVGELDVIGLRDTSVVKDAEMFVIEADGSALAVEVGVKALRETIMDIVPVSVRAELSVAVACDVSLIEIFVSVTKTD